MVDDGDGGIVDVAVLLVVFHDDTHVLGDGSLQICQLFLQRLASPARDVGVIRTEPA